jgi:hypothetical protein
MANPTLDPVPVINATPASSVTVQLVGRDADAKTWTGTGTVTDGAGGTGTTSITIVVGDPLTYALTITGLTVTPVAGSPGRFTVAIP